MLDTATRLTRAAAQMWGNVDRVDRKAARRRVAQFRKRHPKMPKDKLHQVMVNAKCIQTGIVGAISSLIGLIPGIGKIAGRVLGPLADSTVVGLLQSELVAETFALYDIELPAQAERAALLTITASHIGVSHAGAEVARNLARHADRVMGSGLASRALPLAQVATGAASNVALTYAIGMRARALCKMKSAHPGDWPDLLRDFTLVDERRVVRWATTATQTAIDTAMGAGRIWLDQLGRMLPELPEPAIASRPPRPRRKVAAKAQPRKRKRTGAS